MFISSDILYIKYILYLISYSLYSTNLVYSVSMLKMIFSFKFKFLRMSVQVQRFTSKQLQQSYLTDPGSGKQVSFICSVCWSEICLNLNKQNVVPGVFLCHPWWPSQVQLAIINTDFLHGLLFTHFVGSKWADFCYATYFDPKSIKTV